MKKIYSFILVVIMSMSLSLTSFAQAELPNSKTAANILTVEETQALEMINYKLTEKRTASFKQPLHNSDNEVVASMIYLSPVGYMIFDPVENIMVEYSIESNNKYYNDKDAEYVYGGALQYYEKEGGFLKDLKTDMSISLDIVNELIVSDSFYANKDTSTQNFVNTNNNRTLERSNTIDFSIQKSVPNLNKDLSNNNTSYYANEDCYWYYYDEYLTNSTYEYNCNATYDGVNIPGKLFGKPDGVCGSVAAAILFSYYDDYRNDNYVYNPYKNSGIYNEHTYGCSLVRDLVPRIEHGNGGSSLGQLKSGMESYLSSRNINNPVKTHWGIGTEDYVRYGASHNRPTILGAASWLGSEYSDHWVVGIGYEEYGYRKSNGNLITWNFYVKINDGHGKDDVFINISTVDCACWLYNYS